MVEKGKELAEVTKEVAVITAEDVRKFFCDKATEKEIAMFLQIAKLNNLNPFKREIYIVKYGSYPASILTGYEVYLKRAERSGNYGGFKAWTEGTIPDMKACIEVYRKGWDRPLYHEVEYSEYVGRTGQGQPTKFWKEKPKTMLKKVVISQAFRFAFPDELGGMPYTSEEISHVDAVEVPAKPGAIVVPKIGTESNEATGKAPNLNDPGEKAPEAPAPEPMPDFGDLPPDDTPASQKKINEAQRKKLFAVAREFGWDHNALKGYLKVSHNIQSTKDIPAFKFDGILNFLAALPDD